MLSKCLSPVSRAMTAHRRGAGVQEFFRDQPCAGLYRAVEVRDKRGDVVLVVVASVKMPDVGRPLV